VVFERDVEGSPIPKQVKRTLFGPMNPYPQKKILTFNKHQNDFSFHVSYAELDHLPDVEIQALGQLNLSKVELTGVAEAIGKHQGNNVESKGIKAHFSMDESGLLNLANVELVVEKTLTEEELAAQEESPLSKLGSTISNFFTEKSDEKPVREEPEEDKKSESEEKESKTNEEEKKEEKITNQESQDKESDDKKKTVPAEELKNTSKSASGEKKPKVVVIKEPIGSAEEKLGIPELNGKLFEDAVKKLDSLNEFDRQRNRRESALNALESFVFDAQGKLWQDEYQPLVRLFWRRKENKGKKKCSSISDWLYEEGSDADAVTYEAKLSELKTLTGPLYRRVKEHADRPEALAALHSLLNSSRNFLANARNMSSENPDGLFTPVELDTLDRIIKETQEWKIKMEEEQASLAASVTPKLTVKSIADKMALLDREVKYLINKAKIWRPKKPKEDTKDKDSTKNETGGENVPKSEESNAEEERVSEDTEEPIVEGADNQSAEDVVPSLPDPEEATSNLPEESSSQTDGEDKEGMHTEL
ncbi:hypothetical protein L9F63_001099, partial [Diploptera punctata]